MIQALASKDVYKKMNEMGKAKIPFLFVLNFESIEGYILPLPIASDEIKYQCNGIGNYPTKPNIISKQLEFSKYPQTLAQYSKGFDIIQQVLDTKRISLINYTQTTPVKTNFTLEELFEISDAKYKLWIKEQFLCFSPEIFVTIQNGVIASFPMKGTIDAALPDAVNTILNDPKEIAEHAQSVDLLVEDLSHVASEVCVETYRYIDQIKSKDRNLLQTSSKIVGTLPNDYLDHLGDIFATLLPAGSIIGIPRDEAIKVVSQAEGYNRNYYTGIFGVFDGVDVDSGVLIRFIEQTPNGLVYKSGGGVTANSTVEKEYQEMINKVYVPIY